jgi:hypothetical protein
MLRKPGRSDLLRRLAEVETRLMDHSRLAPNSREWPVFWDRQVYSYITDREYVPLTLEAVRAIMRYSDDPASLVGNLRQADEMDPGGE